MAELSKDTLFNQYLICCNTESKLNQMLSVTKKQRASLEPAIIRQLQDEKRTSLFLPVPESERESKGGYGIIELQESEESEQLSQKNLFRLIESFFQSMKEASSWESKIEVTELANLMVMWIWSNRVKRLKSRLVRRDLEYTWEKKVQQSQIPRKPRSKNTKKNQHNQTVILENIENKQSEQEKQIKESCLNFQQFQNSPLWQTMQIMYKQKQQDQNKKGKHEEDEEEEDREASDEEMS